MELSIEVPPIKKCEKPVWQSMSGQSMLSCLNKKLYKSVNKAKTLLYVWYFQFQEFRLKWYWDTEDFVLLLRFMNNNQINKLILKTLNFWTCQQKKDVSIVFVWDFNMHGKSMLSCPEKKVVLCIDWFAYVFVYFEICFII